jgi:hypothetical protein
MSDPVTITLPVWVCVAIGAWLACIVVLLGLINTQLRNLYDLYCLLRDGEGEVE